MCVFVLLFLSLCTSCFVSILWEQIMMQARRYLYLLHPLQYSFPAWHLPARVVHVSVQVWTLYARHHRRWTQKVSFSSAITDLAYVVLRNRSQPGHGRRVCLICLISSSCHRLNRYVVVRDAEWLLKGEIQKFVVVITGVETGDTLERWVFNVETDKSVRADGWVDRKKNNRLPRWPRARRKKW